MTSRAHALVSLFLIAAPLTGYAADQLVPAGSLIQCTVSEPKLSSKTANIGDPVLCRVSHVELYGRSTIPYGTYLVGRFEAYKDPGHLVGKGWMELKFDRMIVQPDSVVPVDAKVVNVPGYPVDREGRIQGKGHPVRDIVEWSIPILWPIDLINLPRRGPRPVLKQETRLTLKVMDDIGIPIPEKQRDDQLQRRSPTAYAPEPEQEPMRQPVQAYAPQAPAPVVQAYAQLPQAAPVVQVYVQQAPPPVAQQYQPASLVVQAYAPPMPVVMPAPVAYGYYAPGYPVVQPYAAGWGPPAPVMVRRAPYGYGPMYP